MRTALGKARRDALLAAVIAEQEWFVEASTGGADDHRRARVHYTGVAEADPVVALVRAIQPAAAAGLGIALPRIARIERQLTRHGDGDYYRAHRDDQGDEAARRALSYVYFFCVEPRAWTGGVLLIRGGGEAGAAPIAIEPEDDSLVVFGAGLDHEVTPVRSAEPLPFSAGRFTVNGWVWR